MFKKLSIVIALFIVFSSFFICIPVSAVDDSLSSDLGLYSQLFGTDIDFSSLPVDDYYVYIHSNHNGSYSFEFFSTSLFTPSDTSSKPISSLFLYNCESDSPYYSILSTRRFAVLNKTKSSNFYVNLSGGSDTYTNDICCFDFLSQYLDQKNNGTDLSISYDKDLFWNIISQCGTGYGGTKPSDIPDGWTNDKPNLSGYNNIIKYYSRDFSDPIPDSTDNNDCLSTVFYFKQGPKIDGTDKYYGPFSQHRDYDGIYGSAEQYDFRFWVFDNTDGYVYSKNYDAYCDIGTYIEQGFGGCSTFKTVVNGNDTYYEFSLDSDYQLLTSGDTPTTSTIVNSFVGSKVETNIGDPDNPSNPELGYDLSKADDDLYGISDRQTLLDKGAKNGRPNTDGDFPYVISIYRNGALYEQFYLSTMPFVSTDFYSKSKIRYNVNLDNIKGYIYYPQQSCYSEFDFTNKVNVATNYISDATKYILSKLNGVDLSDFTNTFTIHMWTNYEGSIGGTTYKGFYTKFNWDLVNSGMFQRNNPDDDYNYHKDYDEDSAITDNNGNTHGGGSDSSSSNSSGSFNNDDFSFNDGSLWGYAGQFLTFCKNAFTIFPSYLWALIGSGIVIIIILRILGR